MSNLILWSFVIHWIIYFVFLTALECSPRASYRAELGVSIEYEYPKRDGNNMGYFNRVHKHLCYNRSYYISLILKWVSYTWKLVFVQRFIISFIKQMPPRWRNCDAIGLTVRLACGRVRVLNPIPVVIESKTDVVKTGAGDSFPIICECHTCRSSKLTSTCAPRCSRRDTLTNPHCAIAFSVDYRLQFAVLFTGSAMVTNPYLSENYREGTTWKTLKTAGIPVETKEKNTMLIRYFISLINSMMGLPIHFDGMYIDTIKSGINWPMNRLLSMGGGGGFFNLF